MSIFYLILRNILLFKEHMHWQGLRLWKYQRVVRRDTKLLKINYSVVRVWSRFKLNGTRKQAIYKK